MVIYLLICVILAIVFGGSYYAYRICFFSPARDRDKIPRVVGESYDPYRPLMRQLLQQIQARPYETVTTRSAEGLLLRGRYYHVCDGAPLDICFHGYRSNPFVDFGGGSEMSFEMGHNLLLVDQRACGGSQGRTITFGIKERQDLLCWVDYAIRRFGTEVSILLYGVSMGGATVLMASGLGLPENVKGIIADCPYSSPKDIILTVARQRGFPPKVIWPFVVLGAKIYGGFDINEITAAEVIANSTVPALILHGEADGYVPCHMSLPIQQANPRMVQRHTFPGADHGISYLADMPRYKQIVAEFIRQLNL